MTEAATRWAAENVDLLGPPLARDPTVPRVRPAAPQLRTQGSIKVPIGLNAIGLGLPGAPSLWDATVRLPPGLTRRTEPGPAPVSNWPPETVDRRAPPPIYPFGVAPDAGGQSTKVSPTKPGQVQAIPGYSEEGAFAWRKANDRVFIDAVDQYNRERKLKPRDPGFWTPEMLKAQAMVESGGDKEEFLRDPLQVNNRGDWDKHKPKYADLTGPDQVMNPATSARAALQWLSYKGRRRASESTATGMRTKSCVSMAKVAKFLS